MELPLEITFRDVPESEALERIVRQKAESLDRYCDHIMSCRVAIERPRRRVGTSDPHRIRIDITVPRGNEIVITEESSTDNREAPEVIVRRAFETAKRRLKELSERQRYDVKTHEEPRALVVRLFPEYGFLRTLNGREIFFHRNSVLAGGFDRLEVGTEVRFEEEEGEMGPQASTVTIESKPGARHTHDEDSAEPPLGWEDA